MNLWPFVSIDVSESLHGVDLIFHVSSFLPQAQTNQQISDRIDTPALYLMDEEFQDLLQQFQIPDPIKDILSHLGYDCTLTFGLAFSSMQMLDQNIQRLLPTGEDDTTSPLCARLRALWSRCNSIHMSPPIPAAQTFPPTPAATPTPSPLNSSSNWRETLPPKINSDDVTAMKQLFEKNYPGEVLVPHSTPSIRLWSLVHQQKINKVIKYIPIQRRLSEHQYSAMIETRSSKPLRSEIQLLSQCHNYAGTIPQRWTYHLSASLAIGSIKPLPS